MYQVYLISFTHTNGSGNTFYYRKDGMLPSREDIKIIEAGVTKKHCIQGVVVTSVSRLADAETMVEDD